jgi:hypothetical protein
MSGSRGRELTPDELRGLACGEEHFFIDGGVSLGTKALEYHARAVRGGS